METRVFRLVGDDGKRRTVSAGLFDQFVDFRTGCEHRGFKTLREMGNHIERLRSDRPRGAEDCYIMWHKYILLLWMHCA